jgi:hypothetical protein
MSKKCTRCAGKAHVHGHKHPKRSRRGVHGVGKLTENDWREFGYQFFVSTAIFMTSRAMINPMFTALLKANITRKEKWVKYVPGTFKALAGFFWFTHADSSIQKMAATTLMSMGIQESIAATNKDLFSTPGANHFLSWLPEDKLTPLLYNTGNYTGDSYIGYADLDDYNVAGVPTLYLEEALAGLAGIDNDGDEIATDSSSSIEYLRGIM